ncbi:MAG: hypothetical protein ACRDHE_14850 [Ktedonobacterales bacterium]
MTDQLITATVRPFAWLDSCLAPLLEAEVADSGRMLGRDATCSPFRHGREGAGQL